MDTKPKPEVPGTPHSPEVKPGGPERPKSDPKPEVTPNKDPIPIQPVEVPNTPKEQPEAH